MADWGALAGGAAGTIIGGPVGGFIGASLGKSLFGGNKDIDPMAKYAAGARSMDETMSGIKKGFNPFIQTGTSQLDPLSHQFSSLMSDPTLKLSDWIKSYQTSPYAEFQEREIAKQLGRQSAASGMFGTPTAQKTLADYTQGIVSKDMQDYLNRAQGLYGAGLSGAQNLAQMGLHGQTSYSQLAEAAEQAKLAALMQATGMGMKKQSQESSDTMKGIGSLAGMFSEGGFSGLI